VRGVRMPIKDRLLCLRNAPSLRVFGLDGDDRGILGGGYRHPRWVQYRRIHVAAIRGCTADRNEATGPSYHDFGNPAQPPIRRDRQVETAISKRIAQRIFRKWIAVNVFDRGRNFRELMAAGMQYRDAISASQQAVDDQMACWSGTANDKRSQYSDSFTRPCRASTISSRINQKVGRC
jgi:hypothetical protein